MINKKFATDTPPSRREQLRHLLNEISTYSNSNMPRISFLTIITQLLIEHLHADEMELWIIDNNKKKTCEIIRRHNDALFFTIHPINYSHTLYSINSKDPTIDPDNFCINYLNDHVNQEMDYITQNGSFICNDIPAMIHNPPPNNNADSFRYFTGIDTIRSVFVIPFYDGEKKIGLIMFKSKKPEHFITDHVSMYETFSQNLVIILQNQRIQAALNERVKELTCMYGIAQASKNNTSIDTIMQSVIELLPPAWQFPSITTARIILGEQIFTSRDFIEGPHKQMTNIMVNGIHYGTVEVFYRENRTTIEEGPFLKEERVLLDNIAHALSIIIEQKHNEEHNAQLQKQVLHADRLATIGQLAAGVAHELNEPLANILGYAQLSKKEHKIPQTVKGDLEKIEKASLHAREIVRKLMFFAKQVPSKKVPTNINRIIKEGIYLIESRCIKSNITLDIDLEDTIPDFNADPSQVMQVLINLLVNSIQAMQKHGTLVITTRMVNNTIILRIKDTGPGIDDTIKDKIFLPFFTTKNINEGTGLGLSVVHGIVVAHNGAIDVDSVKGQGTVFTITFPL